MNCTDTDPLDEHIWSEYLEMGFNIFAVIIGIPINFWSLWRYRKLWKTKRANRRVLLGLNLTVSNLLLLTIYCTTQTAWLIALWWPWGQIACTGRSFLVVLLYHLSSNSLAIIALEMVCTMSNPLKSFKDTGVKRTLVQIMLCFLLAAIFSCPQLFTWGLVEIPGSCSGKLQCVFLYQNDNRFYVAYQFYHAVAVFYAPLLFIIACYIACGIIVGRKLRKRVRLQEHASLTDNASDLPDSSPSKNKNSLKDSQRDIRRRSKRVKRKLFKASAAVVCSYVVCWLPYQTLTVWETILKIKQGEGQEVNETSNVLSYAYFSEALMISGAVINPILYSYNGY